MAQIISTVDTRTTHDARILAGTLSNSIILSWQIYGASHLTQQYVLNYGRAKTRTLRACTDVRVNEPLLDVYSGPSKTRCGDGWMDGCGVV